MLVANGHRHADILGYTLRQFRRYLVLAQKRERRAWREQLLAANWGTSGGEQLKKALAVLQD